MKASNRTLLAVSKICICLSILASGLFSSCAAFAVMIFCRLPPVVPVPWYEKYHGSYAVALYAVILVTACLIFRGRGLQMPLHRKSQGTRASVAVFGALLILGIVNLTPVLRAHIAFQLLLEKAQQGDYISEASIAEIYETGNKAINRDSKEAYFWRSILANYFSHSKGNFQDGLRDRIAKNLSLQEIGVVNERVASWHPRKNVKDSEVEKWVIEAGGDAKKQLDLGNYYSTRQGVAGIPDYKEAAKWYRKATELGRRDAQYSLAEMYEQGRGVDKDFVQALYLYMDLASAHGAYENKVIELLKKMTPDQVTALNTRLKRDFADDAGLKNTFKLAYEALKTSRMPDGATVEKLCILYRGACN